MPTLTPESFWQFSLDWYARENIAAVCLRLQDDYKVNVNLLLLLCWCLQHRVLVTLPQWQQLASAIAGSEDALKRHRETRRAARGTEHYESLKQQELVLEAAQQREMVERLNQLTLAYGSQTAFNPSVAGFIHLCGLRQHPESLALLRQVLAD